MALFAAGTLLKIGNGGTPETFATIAEITDISGPKMSLDTIDTTSHDSVDGWKEYIGGLLSAGDVTFDVNFSPTNATHGYTSGLIRDMVQRIKRSFQLVFPNPEHTTWSFTALVTGFDPKSPVEDALTASITLTITGKPTLA